MNKKLKIGIFLVLLLVIGSVTTVLAGDSTPGTIVDPIVTKSYVDEQINKLVQSGGIGSSGGATPLVVENLNAGDILIGKAGTEMILRGGAATIYGDGSNGIPDVTGGSDLAVGTKVPLNHQLIIPRDDGRGIKITKGPAYVMLRGDYSISR